MGPHAWQELARDPGVHRHVIQVYREPAFLAAVVAEWVRPPLEADGAAVLLASRENAAAICDALAERGLDVAALIAKGRLRIADAEATMARFMRGDDVDAPAFHAAISEILATLPPGNAAPRLWGEMVNILYERGDLPSAHRVESLWNEVLDGSEGRLLCSYRVDNLDPATHAGLLESICEGHSQLIPEADPRAFERAVREALVEMLGENEAAMAWTLFARQRPLATRMPPAETVLVTLNDLQPEVGRRVLALARQKLTPTH